MVMYFSPCSDFRQEYALIFFKFSLRWRNPCEIEVAW
jgi:hypothetical protein